MEGVVTDCDVRRFVINCAACKCHHYGFCRLRCPTSDQLTRECRLSPVSAIIALLLYHLSLCCISYRCIVFVSANFSMTTPVSASFCVILRAWV